MIRNTGELLEIMPVRCWPLRRITDLADPLRGWWAEQSYFEGRGGLGISGRAIDAAAALHLVRLADDVATLMHPPAAANPASAANLFTTAQRA